MICYCINCRQIDNIILIFRWAVTQKFVDVLIEIVWLVTYISAAGGQAAAVLSKHAVYMPLVLLINVVIMIRHSRSTWPLMLYWQYQRYVQCPIYVMLRLMYCDLLLLLLSESLLCIVIGHQGDGSSVNKSIRMPIWCCD